MGSTDKVYSTKKEIQNLLKISANTLNRLTKSGRIKSIKIGRLVRFDPNDLFSKEQEKPPIITLSDLPIIKNSLKPFL